MPKYLAVSPCGICCPFNVTVGQVSRFREKVIGVNLFSLAFMRLNLGFIIQPQSLSQSCLNVLDNCWFITL